jgi:hypothetical protein
LGKEGKCRKAGDEDKEAGGHGEGKGLFCRQAAAGAIMERPERRAGGPVLMQFMRTDSQGMRSFAAGKAYLWGMEGEIPAAGAKGLIRRWLRLHGDEGLTEEERFARHRWRVERLIYACWGLIILKSVFVVWAVGHYAIPFNPLWVIAPTVAFALLATGLYYWLRD